MILGMSCLQSEDHPVNFHRRTVHVRDRRGELFPCTVPLPHPSIGCHVVSAASIRQSIRRNDIEEMGICFLHALRPGDQPKTDPSHIIELLEAMRMSSKLPPESYRIGPYVTGTLEDGAVPPRGCIHRMSEEELQVLRAQLDDLLAKGWIRPSCSPYGALVLFVRKKNKDLRLCIDYRGAKYFSKLDLKSVYHQIEIQPRDRYKTAFKTRYGHFEWIVMPFGLTNAPVTFQAAMTTEFRDLLDRTMLIYLDDILVYSRTLDEHLEHLRAILEWLCITKYKANRDKCEFAQQELEYLGHYVTPQGIRLLADKVEAIQDWPDFLGLASYYMRFVKGFQRIAAPLSRLQSHLVPFEFSDEAWHAFHTLKTALLQAPVLSIYDPTLPTKVTTDASSYGIGAVLEQHDGTGWHPVTSAKRLWGSHSREAGAGLGGAAEALPKLCGGSAGFPSGTEEALPNSWGGSARLLGDAAETLPKLCGGSAGSPGGTAEALPNSWDDNASLLGDTAEALPKLCGGSADSLGGTRGRYQILWQQYFAQDCEKGGWTLPQGWYRRGGSAPWDRKSVVIVLLRTLWHVALEGMVKAIMTEGSANPANSNAGDRRNDILELARAIREANNQKAQLPKVQVSLFDGTNASSWADKFEQLGSFCEWTSEKMLQIVKRYCMVEYKEEVSELVLALRDWPDFKAKLLDKYQLGDQLLDLADLRKVSRRKFGTAKQFITEFERVARLVPDLPDKDRCLIFLENFFEIEQRELMKDMTGRYDWPKIKENLLAASFDQMLYRLLKQQKEDREKEGVSADKDQAVYKTLTDMRNMMADMKEERLKLQVMMVQTKGEKRKGKTPVVEEVSSSSSEEEDEEEVEPARKLTKAERKALNQIRGGEGTSKKQRNNNGGGGQGSNQEQAAQTPPQQPQPQAGGRGRGRGRGQGIGGGRENAGGRGNWQNWFCKYCALDGHGIRFCQTITKDENDKVIYTNIRGEVYDFEGNLIDPNVEEGMRKEVFRRIGRDLPKTFRLTSSEEVEQIELEVAMESLTIEDAKTGDEGLSEEQEEILHRVQLVVKKINRCREAFVQICADMNEEWRGLPQVFLFGGWDRDGQRGLNDVSAPQPGSPSAGRLMATTVLSRPAFKRPATAGLPQAQRARRPLRPRATPEEGPSHPR
ncbi:hypothetical protein CBR_g32252 [Chara braunii]|uniref:Reverse transcriptase domain-containing protein n=1 Tax=Chara braunii TaxID=69332 RepID=A0A388JN94_CHABU|nr:hypothetical protein CBR_g32252 [Chara braunii]|eukprot:GBG59235.1 hypothetical protein CBR_g32252 [Chara braunii]